MDPAPFDFDGTITTKGTYSGFVRFAVRRRRQVLGGILLLPVIVGYRLGLVSDRVIRKAISRIGFSGGDPDRVRHAGRTVRQGSAAGSDRHAGTRTTRMAQGEGRSRCGRVRLARRLSGPLAPQSGCRCQLHSARSEEWPSHWSICRRRCCGEEKARRILDRYALADDVTVYAYGDTEEDRQMLELADTKYLRWEEVRESATPLTKGRRECDAHVIHHPIYVQSESVESA